MGSWNKTCGLTQLPIHEGERVITFLLVKKEGGYHSYSYNNWAWELIPMPIYGTYDDHGWMNVDADQERKLKILHHFMENKLVRLKPYREGIADGPEDLGWNASDDVSALQDKGYVRYDHIKDDPFESFDALGESMHGSLFGMKGWADAVSEISHMMIREDAFISLRETVTLGDVYYPAVEVEHLRKVLETHDQWKVAKEEESNRELADAEASGNQELIESIKSKQFLAKYLNEGLSEETIEEILHPLREEYNVNPTYDHGCIDYWFLSFARYPSRSSEDGGLSVTFLKQFGQFIKFKNMFDAYAIRCIFAQLRKSYSPMGGEGSQESTNFITEKFPLAYLEASHNINNRWGEDEISEEDLPDLEMSEEQRASRLKESAERKRGQAMKLLREADEEFTKACLKKF
jgi:hypothetical protein